MKQSYFFSLISSFNRVMPIGNAGNILTDWQLVSRRIIIFSYLILFLGPRGALSL